MSAKEKIIDFLKGLLAFLKHVSDMIEEWVSGGPLVAQTELAHGEPLGGEGSLTEDIKYLAVKERDLFITQKMDVQGTDGPYCTIKGIELLLSGIDHMRFYLGKKEVCKIHNTRKTRGFNVYRGKSDEKVGWVEKVGDKNYGFYCETTTASNESSETTLLASTEPAYTLSGDFINRRFLMKNKKGENVAKIKKQLISFPAFDHYTVRIAPGMDPILVLACLYVIDEDIEENFKVASNAEDAIVNKAEEFIADTGLGRAAGAVIDAKELVESKAEEYGEDTTLGKAAGAVNEAKDVVENKAEEFAEETLGKAEGLARAKLSAINPFRF